MFSWSNKKNIFLDPFLSVAMCMCCNVRKCTFRPECPVKIQISLCKCKSYSHFFSINICVFAIFNDQNFNDTLTNDIVSFEQLGPGCCLLNLSINW